MIGNLTNIEYILQKQFQRNMKLLIQNEEIKTGQFILFRSLLWQNNFYFEFHLKGPKKIDLVKIPYPFNIEEHEEDNLIYFDYRISTLCSTPAIRESIFKYKPKDQMALNKYFNTVLEIQLN